MIRLYHAPGACSTVVRIALEEAGAEFELVPVDFANAEQRGEAFRAINPNGRVPVLETGQGRLTESVAILDWIARRWPEAGLAPLDDAWAMAQMVSFNAFVASSIHPAYAHVSRPERYAEGEAAAAAMKARAPDALAGFYRIVEDRLSDGRPWLLGQSYSLSDPYLMWITGWIMFRELLDMEQFPLTAAHRLRTRERPVVRSILERESAHY